MVGGIIDKIVYVPTFEQHDLVSVGMYMEGALQAAAGMSVGQQVQMNVFSRNMIGHSALDPFSFTVQFL